MSEPTRARFTAEQVRRRRFLAVVLAVVLVPVLVGLLVGAVPGDAPDRRAAPTASSSPAPPGGTPSPAPPGGTPSPRTLVPTGPTTRPPASDAAVIERGDGTLDVVAGSVPAPGRGKVLRVRVEVERGAGLAPAAFADAVMATLNDDRSWGHGGTRTFARTQGVADVVVVLASPTTSARLCRPLVTHGSLSCSVGDRAVLTSSRWAGGTPEFADLGVYRQYVVNHEVGHVLGRGHASCPGAGSPAPVMQQQTKRVAPCTPNAWPYA